MGNKNSKTKTEILEEPSYPGFSVDISIRNRNGRCWLFTKAQNRWELFPKNVVKLAWDDDYKDNRKFRLVKTYNDGRIETEIVTYH